MELLPRTRPSLPDTESTPVLPAWTRQTLPSEAVPHPLETLRPAKVSWAKTGAPPGPAVGLGEGEGFGLGDGRGEEVAHRPGAAVVGGQGRHAPRGFDGLEQRVLVVRGRGAHPLGHAP